MRLGNGEIASRSVRDCRTASAVGSHQVLGIHGRVREEMGECPLELEVHPVRQSWLSNCSHPLELTSSTSSPRRNLHAQPQHGGTPESPSIPS